MLDSGVVRRQQLRFGNLQAAGRVESPDAGHLGDFARPLKKL